MGYVICLFINFFIYLIINLFISQVLVQDTKKLRISNYCKHCLVMGFVAWPRSVITPDVRQHSCFIFGALYCGKVDRVIVQLRVHRINEFDANSTHFCEVKICGSIGPIFQYIFHQWTSHHRQPIFSHMILCWEKRAITALIFGRLQKIVFPVPGMASSKS